MKKVIALLLALILLLTGCAKEEPIQFTEAPTQETEPAVEVAPPTCIEPMPWEDAEVADFGVRLLRETMEEGKNTLISPLSVLAALSMTANGAEGETLTQMETMLGQSKDSLNAWYKYDADKSGDYLHLANALFIKDDPELTVNDAFIKAVEKWYETDIVMDSFNESTLQGINQYVEDNTHGMVKNILNEIPEEAAMYLVNALAFEARWEKPYNEYQVSEGIFTTEDGKEQTVELMYSEEDYHTYVENNLYTGFLKNYEGGRYIFAALLPNEGVTVEELAASLSGEAISALPGSGWHVKVMTAMPKFEIEFDTQMNEVLKTMGMTDAFDPYAADFSGLATYNGGNIFLNRVIHKTFISVAEQGTRAGAATIIEAAAEAAMEEEIKEVILNRPFLYMILDTETNTPIFMGTFMDAQAPGTSIPADDPDIFVSPAEDPCLMEG